MKRTSTKRVPWFIRLLETYVSIGDWVNAPAARYLPDWEPLERPKFWEFHKVHPYMMHTYDWSWETGIKILGPPLAFPLIYEWFAGEKVRANINFEAISKANSLSVDSISAAYNVIWEQDVPLFVNAGKVVFVFIGIFMISRLILDMWKDSRELGGLPMKRFIPLVVMITLISTPGLMVDGLRGTRDVILQVGEEALTVTALQSKADQAFAIESYKLAVGPAVKECGGIEPGPDQTACFSGAGRTAAGLLGEDEAAFGNQPWIARYRKSIEAFTNIDVQPGAGTPSQNNFLGISVPSTPDVQEFLRGVGDVILTTFEELVMVWMKACLFGSQQAMEVTFLISTFGAPVAVYMSMGDAGALPMYGFLVGLWSTGMFGVWLKMLVGAAAAGFVTSQGAFELAFNFTIGIFAPLFAIGLSGGGGIVIWGVILQKLSFGLAQGANRNKRVTPAN